MNKHTKGKLPARWIDSEIAGVGGLNSVCLFASASGIYKELCQESVKNKYECEIQAACQHWEVRHYFQSLAIKNGVGLTAKLTNWV